jgi:PAS domain S-box-containing protein
MTVIIQDNALKYVNQKFCERLGYSYEEVTLPEFDFVEKLVAPIFQELVRENLQKRFRGEIIAPYQIILLNRTGHEILTLVKGQIITYMTKPADLVTLTDTTERKALKDEIPKSEASQQFDSIVLDAFDEALLAVGESSRRLIYQSIEKKFHVRREELPKKPETLHKTLENMLGASATKIVEDMITKKVYDKLGLRYEKRDRSTLIDYLDDSRKAK